VTENAQGVLRGIAHYWAYFGVELAFDASIACALLIFLLHGSRLNAVIAAEVIAAWAAAAVSMVFVLMFRIEERARLSPRQLLEKSVIFNLYAFMSNLYDRLDVVLLSKLAGDYATGIYGAAYRPLGTLQLVPYGVLYSLLPTLSRNAGGKDERLRLEKAMGFLLSAGFALVLAITIFARPALTLVLGARWADSARALKILIWAVLLRYVNYALNVRLFAGGHESVFVATSTVCLAVNVAGNLILIPKYSWRAAAVMTIVTELILLMQNTYWLRRRVGAIPMPLGWARTSLVFAALMIASLAGSRIFPPQAIGTCCVLCFLAYVYRTGLVGEFAGAWGARQAVG
jgi:O-antigen/teichoic acid export membrane protein